MSRNLWAGILAFVTLLLCVPSEQIRAQAPAKPAIAPAAPELPDLTRLDRATCNKLKQSPLVCPEGPTGEACRFNKPISEKACVEILASSGWLDFLPKDWREQFAQFAAPIIAALVGLAFTAAIGWAKAFKLRIEARESKKDLAKLSKRLFDGYFDRLDGYEQLATNMVIVGEGGSGKTTLIHALSGMEEANPAKATVGVETYNLVHEVNIKQSERTIRRLVRIYVDDYEGQKFTQVANNPGLLARQQVVKSTTLVIVVDVVPPPLNKLSPRPGAESIDLDRVKKHLTAYNEQVIQTLAQQLGVDGQIILFINKIDAISPLNNDVIDAAKEAYRPLIQLLAYVRGAQLNVIVGSAKRGMGIVGFDEGRIEDRPLLKFLIDHAARVGAG